MAAPTESTPAPATRLSGTLGVGSIVFMVVAAAAPLTVIAGTIPLGVGAGNGAAFPATFVLCAVVLLLFAVGFCAMSPHVPDAGAFFTYVRHGLGRPLGMGAAFLALATYTAVQLAVYGYIGAAIDELVTSYGGPSVPWCVWTIAVIAIVAVLGYRHIELSSRVLGVLLLAEIAIVVVLDVVVVAGRRPRGALDGRRSTPARSPPARSASRSCSRSRASSGSRPPRCSATRPATRSARSRAPPTSRSSSSASSTRCPAGPSSPPGATRPPSPRPAANPGTFLRLHRDQLARPDRRAHRHDPAGHQPVRRDPRVPQRRRALLVRPRRAPGRSRRRAAAPTSATGPRTSPPSRRPGWRWCSS